MRFGGNKTTLSRARQLRRDSTLPERLLWAALRRKQHALRFRHQHPAGPYVLDFYCHEVRLCVEIAANAQVKRSLSSSLAWLEGEIALIEDECLIGVGSKILIAEATGRKILEQGIRTIRVSAKDVLTDPEAVATWIAQHTPTGAPRHLPLDRGRS